jgi:hypothetical protein
MSERLNDLLWTVGATIVAAAALLVVVWCSEPVPQFPGVLRIAVLIEGGAVALFAGMFAFVGWMALLFPNAKF